MPKLNVTRAEDLYRFENVTDTRISPDGEHVVYSVQRVDRKTEKKYTNLWMVPAKGGDSVPFTTGDQTDSLPRWSPLGDCIAFLSNRKNEKQPQIHLIHLEGGEASVLSDLKGEFADLVWSHDGKRIAFAFRRKDKEEMEREKDEQKKELGVAARHITRTFFRFDGYGYLPKERWHLWTIGVSSGRARQLTSGTVHDENQPAWSPDGKHIVYSTNLADEPDHDPSAQEICVIPSRGGKARRIDCPVGNKQSPTLSPDGRWIAYFANRGRRNPWQNTNLWVVAFDGKAGSRDLTGKLDVTCENVTLGGLPDTPAPNWSSDSERITFLVSRHGSTSVWSIARSGRRDTVRVEADAAGNSSPFSLDRDGKRMAVVHSHLSDPGQVHTVEIGSPSSRPITRANPWLRGIRQGATEELWFRNGKVHGWILKPPGFRASRKYPSILQIHGGPTMQYGSTFSHEFQYLAANGYVVYYCNPRGSKGYGAAHTRALGNDWGMTTAYEGLMAFANLMARKPYIDRTRMGVTGGSYGGFMTNWIVGHTNRFAAAVTQRCVSNLITLWGVSDVNWIFQNFLSDKPPWKDIDAYWDCSPMKYVGRVKTPTLVMHSENDLRCAKEQGEQFYTGLKRAGVETELVLFPDEPHGLSRGGRTDRRVARLEHMLRWFDRYLK